MKNKILILLCVLLLCSCGGPVAKPESVPLSEQMEVAEGAELFCMVDTQQEAEEIAAQYGIELVRFEAGVATFHTEGDWSEVIREGEEQGWPTLSPNHLMELHQS